MHCPSGVSIMPYVKGDLLGFLGGLKVKEVITG